MQSARQHYAVIPRLDRGIHKTLDRPVKPDDDKIGSYSRGSPLDDPVKPDDDKKPVRDGAMYNIPLIIPQPVPEGKTPGRSGGFDKGRRLCEAFPPLVK